MKRRPKLSLEPAQQVRREPPKGFPSADHADPIAEEEASQPVEPAERSSEPNRQARREPPREIPPSAESADHADDPIAVEEASRSVKPTNHPSGPENPQLERDTAPPPHRSPPRSPTKNAGKTSPAPRPVRRTHIDRATLVKILLAAGIAALSILLLKRRFF